MVQGLGIHLPTQEAQLPSLAGDKRPRATGQRTHTQGSLHHSGRPYTLQLRPDTVKDINSLKKYFPNFTDYAKAFDCVNHNKLWKFLKEMGIPIPPDLPLEKPVCRSGSKLELDMEQKTGSK